MKYIYESHMGGLYCSDDYLEDTYCEQCGDSDWLIGTANTAEEAMNLLMDKTDTFDDTKCESCPHYKDYDYCDEKCENAARSGGYAIEYITEFISENFDTNNMIIHEIYLIAKADKDQNYIYVNCQPNGYNFGDAHALLNKKSLLPELVNKISQSMAIVLEEPDYTTIKEIKTIASKNKVIHIFEIIDKIPDNKEEWNNRASYGGDGWYGYHNKNDLKLIPSQEFLRECL